MIRAARAQTVCFKVVQCCIHQSFNIGHPILSLAFLPAVGAALGPIKQKGGGWGCGKLRAGASKPSTPVLVAALSGLSPRPDAPGQ